MGPANKAPTRNMGIEALRMCSMLMVAVLHILGGGGVLDITDVLSQGGLTGQYMTARFLEISAYCAVNCYALLSGYVGVGGKYRYSNLAVLWLRVLYYTVGITALFALFRPDLVDDTIWRRSFFPVFQGSYWYFTAYVGLFMFIPMLNTAINQLEKRQLAVIVVLLAVLFSVLPSIYVSDIFYLRGGYSALWLVILYVMGGYFRKYGFLRKLGAGWMFAGYFLMVALTWGIEMTKRMEICLPGEGMVLVDYTSPTITAAGVFLLLGFERMKVPEKLCGCIRLFAPLAFSVYLIHIHPLIWENMIQKRFAMLGMLSPLKEAAAVVGMAAGIYVVCSLIDLLREWLFKALQVKGRLISLENKLLGPR